jgi:hypothetical protein
MPQTQWKFGSFRWHLPMWFRSVFRSSAAKSAHILQFHGILSKIFQNIFFIPEGKSTEYYILYYSVVLYYNTVVFCGKSAANQVSPIRCQLRCQSCKNSQLKASIHVTYGILVSLLRLERGRLAFFPAHFWFELLKIHFSLLHITQQFLT